MVRLLVILALAACAGPLTVHRLPPRRPNIIFIMADDLGYGDLGCYGQERLQTPHIDAMAASGVRFTSCYAGSTVCAPSRCVLMTGLHTGHCTVRGNALVPLKREDVTVAEVLRSAGYVTGMFGKWGLGEPGSDGVPTRQGFDEWFGYLNQRNAHNYYPEYLWRGEEKVALGNVAENGVASKKVDYSHDLFTREAQSFIKRHQDEAFFLYLPYTIPHANNEAGNRLGDGMEVPDYGDFAEQDWPQQQKGMAAMIARLDSDVGAIRATLKELNLEENTLVIFTSDNGPHNEGGSKAAFFDSNGPLRGIKRSLHDGGIRVPGMACWPGTIAPRRTSDLPWGFVDVLPTLADLAGAVAPDNLDGVSVLPTLLGREQVLDRFLYWEFHERGFDQAVRWGRWKGVRKGGPDAALLLFDLDKDIQEKKDVAAMHPLVVDALETYLQGARSESKDFPVRTRRR